MDLLTNYHTLERAPATEAPPLDILIEVKLYMKNISNYFVIGHGSLFTKVDHYNHQKFEIDGNGTLWKNTDIYVQEKKQEEVASTNWGHFRSFIKMVTTLVILWDLMKAQWFLRWVCRRSHILCFSFPTLQAVCWFIRVVALLIIKDILKLISVDVDSTHTWLPSLAIRMKFIKLITICLFWYDQKTLRPTYVFLSFSQTFLGLIIEDAHCLTASCKSRLK